MSISDVALLAGLLFLLALISGRIRGTAVTNPMMAVAAGIGFGSPGLNWLSMGFGEPILHALAEVTLVLVLFGDATRIDVRALRKDLGLPVRLLGIGLPLTMALGGIAALVFLPELSFWEAMTLGAVLAPTDAALGQAVVSSTAVPVKIRQALNVESGLNDGIALPFVLLFASLGSIAAGEARGAAQWAEFAALQMTLGPVAGLVVAGGGGWLMNRGVKSGAVEENLERIGGLVLPLICYAGAELVHGNGFIAAFVGGLTFGATQRGRCTAMLSFLDAEGELLMLLVFFGLGAALAMPAIIGLNVGLVLYGLLSLTLVRMLPVSVSLVGSRLRGPTHIFLGWFGPRGLASLLYAILLISEHELPHEELLFNAVVFTSLLSVILHGSTAAWGAAVYGKMAQDPQHCPSEHEKVVEHAVRG